MLRGLTKTCLMCVRNWRSSVEFLCFRLDRGVQLRKAGWGGATPGGATPRGGCLSAYRRGAGAELCRAKIADQLVLPHSPGHACASGAATGAQTHDKRMHEHEHTARTAHARPKHGTDEHAAPHSRGQRQRETCRRRDDMSPHFKHLDLPISMRNLWNLDLGVRY